MASCLSSCLRKAAAASKRAGVLLAGTAGEEEVTTQITADLL